MQTATTTRGCGSPHHPTRHLAGFTETHEDGVAHLQHWNQYKIGSYWDVGLGKGF